jgi:hypothetical protein
LKGCLTAFMSKLRVPSAVSLKRNKGSQTHINVFAKALGGFLKKEKKDLRSFFVFYRFEQFKQKKALMSTLRVLSAVS